MQRSIRRHMDRTTALRGRAYVRDAAPVVAPDLPRPYRSALTRHSLPLVGAVERWRLGRAEFVRRATQ